MRRRTIPIAIALTFAGCRCEADAERAAPQEAAALTTFAPPPDAAAAPPSKVRLAPPYVGPLRIAARDAGDAVELLFIGDDGALWSRKQTRDWEPFSQPVRAAAEARAVIAEDHDLFYVDTAGTLFHLPKGGPPARVTTGAGKEILAAVRDRDGGFEVVYDDPRDKGLMRVSRKSAGWSKPERLTSARAKSVALVAGPERVDAFVVLETGEVAHHQRRGHVWSNPNVAVKKATGALAAAANEDGRIELFYVTVNRRLTHVWQNEPGGRWEGPSDLAPAAHLVHALENHDGRIEVLFTDAEDNLFSTMQLGGNQGFSKPAARGGHAESIHTFRRADGRAHQFHLGENEAIFHDWQIEKGRRWAGEYAVIPPGRGAVSGAPLGAPILAAPEDDWHVNDHTIFKDPSGQWRFFGIVAVNPPRPPPGERKGKGPGFGHAVSASLASGWSWREDKPFIEKHTESAVLWAPHVVKKGERWHMFYTSGGDPSSFGISRRTSDDLKSWSSPDVLFRDGWQARDPMVVRLEERDEWVMYYTATENPRAPSRHVVAYRTSKDLFQWSERAIAYRDHRSGQGYGPTESPFVVRRNGAFYLFLGPRPYDPPVPRAEPNWTHPGYVGTDVLKSARFDRFTNEGYVGHLPAHAAEIVEDGGKWFFTSAGIRQRGLYLSPLTWDD